MSFGRRLTLFFLLIVVLPMAAVAWLLLQVTSESGAAKADARLAAGFETALQIDNLQKTRAGQTAERLARDRSLSTALRSGGSGPLGAVARRLAKQPGVVAVKIEGAGGGVLASAGDPKAVSFADVLLQQPSGGALGKLEVSVTPAARFVQQVATLTGRAAVALGPTGQLAGTISLPPGDVPAVGQTRQIDLNGGSLRARTIDLHDGASLVLLGPTEGAGVAISLRVGILLFTLLAIAVTFTFYLARTMRQLHELTSQQAVTDELTGLSNQRRFRELLAKELERANRFGHPVSLLMLDLDDFKQVNDTYGHLQGDDVLRAVAQAVRGESREVDEPARYGGEELAVTLPETNASGALELAERIRARIEATEVPLREGRGSIGVRVSVGVAELGGAVEDASSLIDAADKALYEAKGAGKNQSRSAGGTAASGTPTSHAAPG